MSQQQVPVIVLAGFLGAGKTTLLNHLLHHSGGTRIGAVVNDFGSIEIDTMAVAGRLGDSAVSLGNGCLCCATDVEELDGLLELLTRPQAGIDLIVVEASGLAEPEELVRLLLASENRRIVYGGLVVVVDAVEFEAVTERHPQVERHAAVADLVILNKIDRVPTAERRGLRARLEELSDRGVVASVSHGAVDPALLLDRRPAVERLGQLSFDDLRCQEQQEGSQGPVEHLHAGYASLSFTAREPLDPRRLVAFLDARPQGVYRLKGYVDFGAADPDRRYAVHAVGRFLRFAPEPWPPGEDRLSQLVLIGTDFDAARLERELAACRQKPEEGAPPEEAMWGVLRYVSAAGEEPPTDSDHEPEELPLP